MTQKFNIANHLTGVLLFGESEVALTEREHLWVTGWQFSTGERPSTGWKQEYNLNDQKFHILEEKTEYLHLENVETGVRFYVGGCSYSVAGLEKIPVD